MSLSSFFCQIYSHPEFGAILSIPFVTMFVTWAHVWMALKMLFYPIGFWGIRVKKFPDIWLPQFDKTKLDKKSKFWFLKFWQIKFIKTPFDYPGIGWQGIVPRKAGKISGIIVDQTLSKLGSLDEFFNAMEPEEMADFISTEMSNNLESLIDEIMMDRLANLWGSMPYAVKRRIYNHVDAEIPNIVKDMVVDLTHNVEDLVDMREMIVKKMENDRELMVDMFLKVGQKEINFIWHISAAIGLFFGILQMILYIIVPVHWTVPFFAAIWGFLTNWIAIWMVFNPVEPRIVTILKCCNIDKENPWVFKRAGKEPFTFPRVSPCVPHLSKYNWQGGFMKRQMEVSDVFSGIVVKDLVTLESIMTEMMYGKQALKTRALMKSHMYEMLESPLIQTTLTMGLGKRDFGQLKNTIVDKSISATMTPIRDPELNRSRAQKIFGLFRDRIRELTPQEFEKLLRPAFEEDETTLIVLGAVTGFLAGLLHLLLVF